MLSQGDEVATDDIMDPIQTQVPESASDVDETDYSLYPENAILASFSHCFRIGSHRDHCYIT